MLDLLLDKQNLFAVSLFPYLGFLWFLTKSGQTPKLALIGFYVLLVFVVITIPAGLYAQDVLGEELANVDVLHGGAEAFLTLSNILVVLGFRQGIRQLGNPPADAATDSPTDTSPATPQPDSPG